MTPNTPVRFGVIGAGRIGKIHAGNLTNSVPGAVVLKIADTNFDAACQAAATYHTQAIDDYHEILNDPQIDAVAICSSTDTHARLIVEAAEAGKHIFCEKPIAYDLAQIDKSLLAVERAGVKLQIGFNRRFDANFSKVRDMVQSGKIGDLHILRITSRDPAPPPIEYIKVSGGIFFDMTIHDFDMARYLSGSEVEQVFVAGAVRVDPAIGAAGDIDTAIITLFFKNGVIGTIDNSRKAVYGYDQRVEVFGSAGMAQALNNTPDTIQYANADCIETPKPLYFFLERYMNSFIEEMKQFVDCVQTGRQPSVTGMDGRIPVLMAMAAKKSYLEHRPVSLSEVGG